MPAAALPQPHKAFCFADFLTTVCQCQQANKYLWEINLYHYNISLVEISAFLGADLTSQCCLSAKRDMKFSFSGGKNQIVVLLILYIWFIIFPFKSIDIYLNLLHILNIFCYCKYLLFAAEAENVYLQHFQYLFHSRRATG